MTATTVPAKIALVQTALADRNSDLNFKQIQAWINSASSHLGTVQQQLSKATATPGVTQAEIDALQSEIDVINLEIANLQAEITALTPTLPQTYVLDALTTQFTAVREDTPGTAAILSNTTDSGDSILGLTKIAGAMGASVPVFGPGSTATNAAWTWTPNLPVFDGVAGALTQTVPTSGYIAPMGYALDATNLLVQPSKPVFQNSNDTLPQAMYMGMNGLPMTLAKFGYLKARTVVTTNVASLSGLGVQNGITPVDGTRILLTGQTTASQNGVWSTHAGAWTRPLEFDANTHASGTLVYAQLGTTNSNTLWQCTTTPVSDQVGVNNLAFALTSAGGTVTSFSAGNLGILFTTSVATATTTPALTFALVAKSHGQFFASNATTDGLTPDFRSIVGTDLPLATTSLFGAVKPDGTTITISAGVISAVGAGSVTSVALALPASTFSISGSPVTSTGTLTGALINQSANTFFRGPISGGAATPTWGALVAADLPAGTGTVTSVSLATSVAGFFQSGSPVTGSGTLNLGINSQSANTAFIAPNGSSGVPTWRVLAVLDIPSMLIFAGIGGVVSGSATAAALWTTVIPANTIPANGRVLRARYAIGFTGISATTTFVTLSLNGVTLAGGVAGFPSGTTDNWLEFDITRTGTTTAATSGLGLLSPISTTFTSVAGNQSLGGLSWTGSQNLLLTVTQPAGVVSTGLNAVVQLL